MRTRCECQQPVKTGLAPDHEVQRHRGWVGLVCTALYQHQRWNASFFCFHQRLHLLAAQAEARRAAAGDEDDASSSQNKKKYSCVEGNMNRNAVVCAVPC